MQTRPAGRGRTARRLAAVLLAVSATAVAGCGFDVQTNAVYQPAVGADKRSQTVDVLAAVIISSKPGQGVFLATVVNNSDTTGDKLISISGADGVKALSSTLRPDLPPNTPVNLADAGGIALSGDAINPERSGYVEVTLTFADSDPVTINTPTFPPDGPYARFGVTSSPNSTASKGAAGALPSGATPTPSASPSGTASPTGGTQ